MAKALLLVLVCLSYLATCGIIITPVTFEPDPEPQPTDPTPPDTNPTQPDPDSTANSDPTEGEENSEPDTTTGESSEPVSSDPSIDPTGPTPIDEPNTQPGTPSEPPTGQESSSDSSSRSRKRCEQNSRGQSSANGKSLLNCRRHHDRGVPITSTLNLILMKQFPSSSGLLPHGTQTSSASRTFDLAKQGTYELSFFTHAIAVRQVGFINKILLDIVHSNGINRTLELTPGLSKQSIVVQGKTGSNLLSFALRGVVQGQGLLYLLMNQFQFKKTK